MRSQKNGSGLRCPSSRALAALLELLQAVFGSWSSIAALGGSGLPADCVGDPAASSCHSLALLLQLWRTGTSGPWDGFC